MKNTLLVLAIASIVFVAGCSNAESTAATVNQPDTSKTALQKKYNTEAECKKEFPVEGDCVVSRPATASTGAGTQTAGTGGSGLGMLFWGPMFYSWGAVSHNNGTTSYNNRVPTAGYSVARNQTHKGVNFSKAPPASRATRGGFGGSTRGSSARSYGG